MIYPFNVGINRTIGLVMPPRSSDIPFQFADDLLDLLLPICDEVVFLTGEDCPIDDRPGLRLEEVDGSFPEEINGQNRFRHRIRMVRRVAGFEVAVSARIFQLQSELDLLAFYIAWPFHALPLLAGKIARIPTVEFRTRTKPADIRLMDRLWAAQDRLLLRLIDFVVPESPSVADYLPLRADDPRILPHAPRYIDINRFDVKIPYGQRPPRIGYVGRLDKRKGVDALYRAFEVIGRRNPSMEFLIGGTGPLLEPLREKSERQSDLDISLPGWIPDDELPDVLNSLQAFVLPTRHPEGLPTVILESFACGTPVLATPQGAIPDVVKEGETGFLLSSHEATSIARKIESILNDSRLETMSDNCRDLVQLNYSFEVSRDRWENVLTQLFKIWDMS